MSSKALAEPLRLRATSVMRRFQGAGWLESVRASIAEYARLHPREVQGIRSPDLAELTRREELKLVQRVFLGPAPRARRTVLFTGVEPDGGSAQTCFRTAQTLARLTRRTVCAVDANLRAPALHRLAGTDNRDGLATALSRPRPDHIFASPLTPSNLWVLPSGESDEDPEVLMTAARVGPYLEALGSQFEHILINAPPIHLYAESQALSQLADGVLLVLEANITRREIVRSLKTRLEDLNIPLLGVVLNNRTFPIPDTLYQLL